MAPRIVNVTQGTKEWLDFKRGKIGGSYASVIMGENPWKSRLQLWSQIIEDEKEPINDNMRRGMELEPEARQKISMLFETDYQPVCMESCKYPWMICSLDGWSQKAEVPALEIKAPQSKGHLIAKSGKVPLYNFAQLQHNMYVAEADQMLFASYCNNDLATVVVSRDEEYIKNLIDLEHDFYHRICSFTPPECDERDYLMISDPEALQAAKRYYEVSVELKKLEELHDQLKNNLILSAGHKNARIGDVKVTKVVRRGNVDYTQIEALKGLDLEPFRKKPITSWRIS